MFHTIPESIQKRMETLEAIDTADQNDGTPRMSRLRQITRDTGRLLAMMLAAAPAGQAVEIGTSAGYSALWMSLACRENGRKLHTFELMEEKIHKARETFRLTGVEDVVELVEGDALLNLERFADIGFCFCDTEKFLYEQVYELVVARMRPGGLFLADNCISHADALDSFLKRIQEDPRMDTLLIPIGTGVLVGRKLDI
jgi:caffeoyl-CoA O-methyltransferase